MLKRILTLVSLFVLAGAGYAAPVILVFGDSLSSGYGLPREAGWVSLLKNRVERTHPSYQVVNASISGETTLGGLNRIGKALETHHPAIIILELGGNDGLRGLSLEATRDNLDRIIGVCRKAKARILLVGMQLPPNYGKAYTQKFQAIYPQVAQRYKLRLVPFLLEGIANDDRLFQADRIHPTAAAQLIMLDNVWKRLQPMLRN